MGERCTEKIVLEADDADDSETQLHQCHRPGEHDDGRPEDDIDGDGTQPGDAVGVQVFDEREGEEVRV